MSGYENADANIRSTAQLLISNAPSMTQRLAAHSMPPGFDISRTHSINLITEEFLGGYMQDGRMSVIRRFFCLFVTFDLIFVSLLWLICTMINGESIYQAFQKQIVHYTIYTSLFDVVGAALLRFLVLIFFYAILYINHWLVIALSTSGSCMFLIAKVFYFDWVDSSQQVFQVILILTSFVLAWGEAWFLDCRVIPQERHARRYFNSATTTDRSPLIAPFLASDDGNRTVENASNFYSPYESAPNSDDEDEQDEEYHKMGLDCIRKVNELLESNDWVVDKVTAKGDTIHCLHREKLGKVYKLTARLKYPAKLLLEEMFYKVEDVQKWNPTVIESKIMKKINSYTDITYQTSASVGGGIVKSRDFVNLRCWRIFMNGGFYDPSQIQNSDDEDEDDPRNRSYEGSVSTISDSHDYQAGSVGSGRFSSGYNSNLDSQTTTTTQNTLSKSLGARGFTNSTNKKAASVKRDYARDSRHGDPNLIIERNRGFTKDHVWIISAISIPYDPLPATPKYIRGENLVTGFALREISGKPDICIMEWVLCLDLKGFIPRYVLDTTYTTFMSDYMLHLRKYIRELSQKRAHLKLVQKK